MNGTVVQFSRSSCFTNFCRVLSQFQGTSRYISNKIILGMPCPILRFLQHCYDYFILSRSNLLLLLMYRERAQFRPYAIISTPQPKWRALTGSTSNGNGKQPTLPG